MTSPSKLHSRPKPRWGTRVSDLYLLALAAANGDCFATFDPRIPAESVAGGAAAMEVIPVAIDSGDGT